VDTENQKLKNAFGSIVIIVLADERKVVSVHWRNAPFFSELKTACSVNSVNVSYLSSLLAFPSLCGAVLKTLV